MSDMARLMAVGASESSDELPDPSPTSLEGLLPSAGGNFKPPSATTGEYPTLADPEAAAAAEAKRSAKARFSAMVSIPKAFAHLVKDVKPRRRWSKPPEPEPPMKPATPVTSGRRIASGESCKEEEATSNGGYIGVWVARPWLLRISHEPVRASRCAALLSVDKPAPKGGGDGAAEALSPSSVRNTTSPSVFSGASEEALQSRALAPRHRTWMQEGRLSASLSGDARASPAKFAPVAPLAAVPRLSPAPQRHTERPLSPASGGTSAGTSAGTSVGTSAGASGAAVLSTGPSSPRLSVQERLARV